MLEIAIMVLAGMRINKLAAERSLSKGYVALVLLIPLAGILMGIVGLLLAVVVGAQDLGNAVMILFYLTAEVATAFLVVAFVKSRGSRIGYVPQYAPRPAATPAAPVKWQEPIPAPPAPPAMPQTRMAGYCAECGDNVWLAADGSCSKGHPASSVSNTYVVSA